MIGVRKSLVTEVIRQERRERFEDRLRDQDPSEYREYVAAKNARPEDRRNDVTGY
jgi:hypothetical protein